MKRSERAALEILKAAFTSPDLESYVFTIQDYFADETDQLAEDNPKLEDYLNDIIPEFTEAYDNRQPVTWLATLQKIIENAESLIKTD